MKNIILYIAVILFFGMGLQAQQLSHTTPFQEMHHLWNPAFTAPGTKMDISAFYRQKWVGFEGAPNTAAVSIQYPFVDMNMSAGGLIISDWTGNVNKTGIQLNYAYKLKELLNRDDQLVIGIDGYFHQYRFDASSATTNVIDDPLLNQGRQTKFIPSFGGGIAYFSGTEEYGSDNLFYVGFSTLQLLAADVLIDSGNAKRSRHYFANMGTKLFGYDFYVEPSFQINYVNPQIIDYVIGAKYEMEETFWAGLAYSSLNDFSLNGGVILDEIGGRYTQLKIGALASINSGAIINAGANFEIFLSYTLDVD